MPDVTITPSENGPYIVSGPVTLVAPDGHVIELYYDTEWYDQPFCDGTHATIDFDGTLAN